MLLDTKPRPDFSAFSRLAMLSLFAGNSSTPSPTKLISGPVPSASRALRKHSVFLGSWYALSFPAEHAVRPNHSLHPGPATAGVVSPARASGSIVTRRDYNTRLRGPGELER